MSYTISFKYTANKIQFVLSVALILAIMAGCGVSGTPQTDSAAPVPPELTLAQEGSGGEPLFFLGQGAPLGDGGKDGYYYMSQRADGSFNIRYVDYASRSEIVLCNRPECTHDNESCTAWRPYGGSEAGAIPIGDGLYTIFYGSGQEGDFARYGDLAKMRIEKSAQDGSGTKELIALEPRQTLEGGIAADSNTLYMTVQTVEQEEQGDQTRATREIYAVHLQDGTVQKSKTMEQTDLQIIGAADRKLLLRYYDVAEQLSQTTIEYMVYDVDTGESNPLAFEGTIGTGAVCVKNELCWLDKAQNAFIKLNFLDGTSTSLPLNMEIAGCEQVRLSEPLQTYANVYLYGRDGTETRALLALNSGELFPLTMEMDAPDDVPNKSIKIFAQVEDDTFLVAQGLSYGEATLSAGAEESRFVSSVQYTLAMLPVQSCLANKADFQPIQRVS